MKKKAPAWLLPVLLTSLCVSALVAREPAKDIVFPPPPDAPRIKYLYSLASGQDLRDSPVGFLGKLWALIVGGGKLEPALNRPYGVCARRRTVYVADSEGASVVVFDRDKKAVRMLGRTLKERLVSPIGVAVDESGIFYVTDSVQNVVKVLDPQGTLLFQFGSAQNLLKPTGIAYDAVRRRVLVADTGNSRLLIFDDSGRQLMEIGEKGSDDGEFAVPVNVAVGPDGKIYVVDTILCRVQVFSPEGGFLLKFGQRGDVAGHFARPRGIALDSDGNIYVADALFNAVQMFNQQGQLLMFFGGGGNGPGAFDLPAGLFIDPNDRIYVADSLNRRIQVFQYLKATP